MELSENICAVSWNLETLRNFENLPPIVTRLRCYMDVEFVRMKLDEPYIASFETVYFRSK